MQVMSQCHKFMPLSVIMNLDHYKFANGYPTSVVIFLSMIWNKLGME